MLGLELGRSASALGVGRARNAVTLDRIIDREAPSTSDLDTGVEDADGTFDLISLKTLLGES